MGARFAEKMIVLPILGPVSTTDGTSDLLDASQAHWMTFLLQVGNFTSDSTDICTVTVEASTATTTNATTIKLPFHYRLTSAVGTDTQGTITAVSTGTDGVALTAEDDNKMLIIDVDPACIPSVTDYTNHRYVGLTWDCSAEVGEIYLSAVALLEPRYPGNAIPDVT